MDRKTILEVSLAAFGFELQKHVQAGWEIDETAPCCIWGIAYECGLIKRESTEDYVTPSVPSPVQKMTRAEVLVRAREAKANKSLAMV